MKMNQPRPPYQPLRIVDHPQTSRWTSRAYEVQFGQIETLKTGEEEMSAFSLSAWGLSRDLRALLSDYSDVQIHDAAKWVTMQQNNLVADILEQMSYETQLGTANLPPLEQLFITVEAELFLPHGLRLPVTCVTNIVPHDPTEDSLEKFVAVLDPGEVRPYIQERRENNPFEPQILH